MKDANGNFFSTDGSGNVVDSLGRTLVKKTVNWPTIYYDVLNSQGTTSRFTVSTQQLSVQTSFKLSGVTEYSGYITVLSSIQLPDSTSYSFYYDLYGSPNSVHLPSGGVVVYDFGNFAGNSNAGYVENRWLTNRTAGSGTWTYTPATASGSYACQKVTVAAPDGGNTVYTFAVNNGAWNTETDYWLGSVGSGSAPRTVVTTWDFSNSCPLSGCPGAAYIRKLSQTSSEQSAGGVTLNTQTQYTYDSPQNGNITAIKGWELLHRVAPRLAGPRDRFHLPDLLGLHQQARHQPRDRQSGEEWRRGAGSGDQDHL